MNTISGKKLTGERALFGSSDISIRDCIFDSGESPLKESRNIEVASSSFRYKYPLWYCDHVKVTDSSWFEMARAGVWYTSDIEVKDSLIQAPKNFRRADNVALENVHFTNAEETLWSCSRVKLKNVTAKGNYFLMNSTDIEVDGLMLDGNYSFDGVRNVTIRNSKLLTKDAFWNSENVTVYDSFISGEYLGWNSKNLTLINCTFESLQGLCYIDGLKMVNCKAYNTTLAFEYSENIDASLSVPVDSIFNPGSGSIEVPETGELIIESDIVDPARTRIVCPAVLKRSDRPEWKESDR